MPEVADKKTPQKGMKRVKMLTSQAGYMQVPVMKDGKPVFDSNGKPKTDLGSMFVRDRNKEYDIPESEANALIESGQATEV